MTKRTYYCCEMGGASYPPNEIHAQTRPFRDAETLRRCHKVRATSAKEAAEMVRNNLSEERGEALRALDRKERGVE